MRYTYCVCVVHRLLLFFRVLYFSVGAAVLGSEFRENPESGLRIELSSASRIETMDLTCRFSYEYIYSSYIRVRYIINCV